MGIWRGWAWTDFFCFPGVFSAHCCAGGSTISLRVGFFGYSGRHDKNGEKLKDQATRLLNGVVCDNKTFWNPPEFPGSLLPPSLPLALFPTPPSLLLFPQRPALSPHRFCEFLALSIFLSVSVRHWERVCPWLQVEERILGFV